MVKHSHDGLALSSSIKVNKVYIEKIYQIYLTVAAELWFVLDWYEVSGVPDQSMTELPEFHGLLGPFSPSNPDTISN